MTKSNLWPTPHLWEPRMGDILTYTEPRTPMMEEAAPALFETDMLIKVLGGADKEEEEICTGVYL